MKNKLLMIFIPSMFVLPAFSVDWQTELKEQFVSDSSIQLGGYEYGNLYIREKNILKIKYNLEMPIDNLGYGVLEAAEKIHEFLYQSKMDIFSDFKLKNDGFLYAVIANEPFSSPVIEEVPMIFGSEFSFAMRGMTSFFQVGTEEYKKWLWKYAYEDGKYGKTKYYKFYHQFYSDIINNVKSSTHLIETSHGIEFDYSGICLDWYLDHDGEWPADEINPYCFPWVENAADSGIGEWIEFDLSSPQSTTYILNGFVDGNRMHLYKANSRMKEAEVTGWTESGKEIKQNVHFEDFVYFKTVQFSEPVTKFRITIKETYPGEKWQDTAISAVMFPVLNK